MKQLETYFYKQIGVKIKLMRVLKSELNKLPVYLRNSYEFYTCTIFEREILFGVKDAEDNNTADQYKKQNDIIVNTLNLPLVFVFENIAAYNRKRLIEKKVSFIVPGKQMYIPFLILDLKEYKHVQKVEAQKLFPAAQCLFIHGLLNTKTDHMNFQQLAKELGYGKMTITRAANTLSGFNLCRIEGNRNKTLVFERNKDTWQKALPYLINPVEKQFGLETDIDEDGIFLSCNKALSHYTNLNDMSPKCYAVAKEVFKRLLNKGKMKIHDGIDSDVYIQIWKYNPGILTADMFVDPLSLYLIFRDEQNERIESEFAKLIERLW
jgi:hypothetical protein